MMEQKNQRLFDLLKYPAIFAVTVGCYIVWRLCAQTVPTAAVKLLMAAGIIACAAAAGIKLRRCPSDSAAIDDVIRLVVICGIIMRIGYMLLTPCTVRQNDLWECTPDGYGHAGYVINIAVNGALPDSNIRQYYQQPFYYIVSGAVSRLVNKLLGCTDMFYIADTAKTVSCAASCMMLLLSGRLCDMTGTGKRAKLFAVTLTAFIPNMFISCKVTPDALTGLMLTLAFIYTLRWMNDRSWKNTVILAIIYGVGVMTKISVAVMALFTLAVMVWALVCGIREKQHRGTALLLLKYFVFGVISLPLGLWYSVRNYIRFGQSFGYVLYVGKSSPLFTGDHSLIQRYLFPDIGSLLNGPYVRLTEEYNLLVYNIKTACFGEFRYEVPSVIAILLEWSAAVLAVCVIAAIVCTILRAVRAKKDGRKPDVPMLLLIAACGLFCASIMFFYLRYPFVCSMDYRYMLFLAAPGAVVLAKHTEECGTRWFNAAAVASLGIFACTSCIMYIWVL